MKVARSVAEVLAEHTTLTLECIDRMYLNVYVPLLQRAAGAAYFFRKMRGAAVPSSALMGPMTQRFVDAIKSFAARNGIEIVSFRRGERKDDRTRQYLRNWAGGEGVLYIGKAQEKAKVVRTERRHDPATGDTYPWLAASTAMVNQFYFYAVDDDFGPFFLKFCSYFPYNAKLCINGHEYLKRQLTKQGIAYESLDNGILRCSDPERLQRLADGLTAGKVDALLRKWLARLPHPFTAPDHQQGIRYDISILQAEFALTQVFDRPQGFRNRELRETVASLCGLSPDDYGAGRMTYDLRRLRLRLRGIIERIPRTQRYRLTAEGLCVALAYHRTQARVLGPVLSATLDGESTTRLRAALALYDREVDRAWHGRALAA